MNEDILKRAKKALIDDDMTYEDYDECISLLIAEVEAKRNLALDMLTKNKDLLDRAMRAEAEVERLRNLPRADVAAYDRRIQEMAARIKELEAELENLNGMGTVGYMLGYKKGGDGNKVLIDYIKRLEAAFLESEAENQFHQDYGESDWEIHPDEEFDDHHGRNWYREEAREALERIRSGKDEN